MPKYLQYVFGFSIVALLIGGPLAYTQYWHSQIRHFRIVREGVLVRSAQTSLSGLARIIRDYGVRTVVTLRDAAYQGDPPPDLEEEEYCKKEGIRYVRISPRTWWSSDGSVPAEEGIRQFLSVMDDLDNHPVLIHCFAGIHRTGAFCAVYRMEYEHWTNEQAIGEMRKCGYCNIDDEWDLLGFLEQYQPRWKKEQAAPPTYLPPLITPSEPQTPKTKKVPATTPGPEKN